MNFHQIRAIFFIDPSGRKVAIPFNSISRLKERCMDEGIRLQGAYICETVRCVQLINCTVLSKYRSVINQSEANILCRYVFALLNLFVLRLTDKKDRQKEKKKKDRNKQTNKQTNKETEREKRRKREIKKGKKKRQGKISLQLFQQMACLDWLFFLPISLLCCDVN